MLGCPILTIYVLEFMPYVFQLWAKLLELEPTGALPNQYQALVQPLMMPTLWETRGTVPALTRLLAAIIPRASRTIVAENHIQSVLGIFQTLLAGKKTEQNAFDLLESITISIERYVLPSRIGSTPLTLSLEMLWSLTLKKSCLFFSQSSKRPRLIHSSFDSYDSIT